MDDEAEAKRELDRLRAELTGFVVDAMAERMADGSQPQLGAQLAEAIDRRVDTAVEARVAKLRWPDPDDFAADVIAAARGGDGGAARAARPGAGKARSGQALPFGLGFLTALAVALVAWLVYGALQRPAAAPAAPPAPIANGVEPTSTGPVNVMIEGGSAGGAPGANQQQAPVR